MNILFAIFIVISTFLACPASPSTLLSAVQTASQKAFALSASLAGIYAFWMGIMQILSATPILPKTQRFLSPWISKLFPGESAKTQKLICLNISANLLGIGNAATPMAISAIKEMQKNIKTSEIKTEIKTEISKSKISTNSTTTATKNMLMLFILNATSLQILPTTIISLRESSGSQNPASIILPSILASICATILGVALLNIFEK